MRTLGVAWVVIALGARRDGGQAIPGREDEQKRWNATYEEPRKFEPSAFLREVGEDRKPRW